MKLKELNQTKTLKDIKEKYKTKTDKLSIQETSSKIIISLIVVSNQSNGIGTEIMQDIIKYADKTNKIVVLTPTKEFGGAVSRLIKFYKRFGFIENKGKNKDYEISETMYRINK